MAGMYVDVPGPRMAYHRDGTVGVKTNSSTWATIAATLTGADLQALNDESGSELTQAGSSTWHGIGLIFPELRDVVGLYIAASDHNGSMGAQQWSANTTNGMDGTWTTFGAWPQLDTISIGSTPTHQRSAIASASLTGIKGLRWNLVSSTGSQTTRYSVIHIYGSPTAGEVRYLLFTDTGGTEVSGHYFDFGDDPRDGTAEVKTFKVKNGHATLTATSILLSASALTEKSPIFADDYMFSADSVTYTATLNIGDLAPGASSGTLYVRRTTPMGAALGLETGMLLAIAASWS